jgi:hypothetical protein
MVKSSTCVIILGGHRCGTSAVAGALKHLGVFMGHRYVGATPFNKKGHFEDVAFLTMHKKIVGNWKRPCVDFEPYRKGYTKLIRSRERQFPLWGFKDPRFCYVFPYFQRVTNSRLKVISIHRSLEASINSLVKRRKPRSKVNVSRPEAAKIARHYRDAQWLALRLYRGTALTVQYEVLVKSPGPQVQRIANFVGRNITAGAVQFIDKKLRHF